MAKPAARIRGIEMSDRLGPEDTYSEEARPEWFRELDERRKQVCEPRWASRGGCSCKRSECSGSWT